VLRPKNAQNSTKNGKNLLLQKKFYYFSMDQFSSFYGKNYFSASKTSSNKFKLTYKTKKKNKKKIDVKAQTTVPSILLVTGGKKDVRTQFYAFIQGRMSIRLAK
jgi:hypothetical protein